MAGSVSSSPSLVDSLFQRSLDDLIKSLRSHPAAADPSSVLLSRALDDIRREIRSTDPDTKAVALQKLTYLSSLHAADMSWAAFHALELLPSASSFLHKKVAYLAASLSFHPSTDVLLLATHQLRKDLNSTSDAVASLALEFLSVAATPDLARDLTPELYALLASSRFSIRKKSTAVILRFFTRYPDSVRVAFKRLVENLECADQRVVSAAVGVFCELSAADARSYLPLAPEFYRILVDCKNNWVLIKVLKIFSRLAPLETRLARRVVEPVCEHMRRSVAKSLVFECIRTVFLSLDDYDHAVRLGVEKVKELLTSEDDPNLRYLGLHALSILRPRHSWAVEENREVVIKSLGDSDPNIQREALHLIMGMVSESNLIEISILLVNYALKSDPEFCNEILGAILSTCSRNFYELVVDFDWYVSLLVGMSRNPHCGKGEEIERQLVDIGMRVKDVRPELIHVVRDLLIDPTLLGNPFLCRILSAAAWVSGEYVEFSRNPVELVEALLQPRTNLLPMPVRAVYIQAVFKVLIFCFHSYFEHIEAGLFVSASDSVYGSQCPESSDVVSFEISSNCKPDVQSGIESEADIVNVHKAAASMGLPDMNGHFAYESILHMLNLIETSLGPLIESDEVEVQERARNVLGFIRILKEIGGFNFEEEGFRKDTRITEIVKLMHDAFTEEVGPVSANAQERVPIPDGLNLKDNLSDLATVLGDGDVEPPVVPAFSLRNHHDGENKEEPSPSTESMSLLSEHRKRHGLYYLPTDKIETGSNEYPHANDPQLPVSHGNAAGDTTEELLQLTEQSLVPRRTKQAKPRPVVVKLAEGDGVPASSMESVKESKYNLLSGAVRDVLLGNEGEPTSSRIKSSDKSSRRRVKDISENSESMSQSKENLGDIGHVSPSSRRGTHQSHSKDKHKSPKENVDKEEEKNRRNSRRSSHHHGRHKHKQKGEAPLNVVPQSPVIQDFLL